MSALFDQIKDFCLSCGFDRVAGIEASDYQHFAIYQNWVQSGRHADMQYLSSERALHLRRSPFEIMPACRTILVLVKKYPAVVAKNKNEPEIAAYALQQDYHQILPPLLEEIIDFIRKQYGLDFEAKSFSDSAAVLERELACQAGLGWIGKNSSLINPQIGSYFLLAEIFLDIDLSDGTDLPNLQPDRCGTCRRCIESCPTHSILEDRTLDAAKCIAYLTIENKGVIPPELRSKMGNHLFGCDLCQQVCPWNQKHLETIEEYTAPISMEGIHTKILDEDQFRQFFKHSPISRSKRSGFYRNLAVVLGNLRDLSTLPLLEQLLLDTDPLVRRHAAWALAQFQLPASTTILNTMLEQESDQTVRQEITQALNP